MNKYIHDYTKLSVADSHLFLAQQACGTDNNNGAWKHIEDARRLLQEYQAQVNMDEDDDVTDGCVKALEDEVIKQTL